MKHEVITADTAASDLFALAHQIVFEGARAALHCNLSDREWRTWENAARFFLRTDGDDEGDFAAMVAEHFDEPLGYGQPDQDFARDERTEQLSFGL